MDLKIRVKGESSITRLAERCILRLTIALEGSELESISKDVISRTNEVRGLLKTLSNPLRDDNDATESAAAFKIASTFLRTTSRTPHDKDNRPLPKVYEASMALSIVFSDVSLLSQALGRLMSSSSDVEIQAIDWSLSEATRNSLRAQLRKEAVRDAITKAGDIAGEVGRKVYPVEVVEDGEGTAVQHPPAKRSLFSSPPSGGGGGLFGGGGPASNHPPQSSGELDLSPPDIRVTTSMNVEFRSVAEE